MTETVEISAMTEKEQREYIRARLSDKWWRMNNLYMIENEQGKLVRFRLRPAQELLFRTMWYLNIILKARQLGFSTAIDIYLLDEALFNKNLKCGIIAQDLTAAGEIYRTKIEVPFDNLPGWLKAQFQIAARRGGANGGHILFRHGSSIQVAHLSGLAQSNGCMFQSTVKSAPSTQRRPRKSGQIHCRQSTRGPWPLSRAQQKAWAATFTP